MKITIDLFKILFVIVAVTFAVNGLISWWIILLFFLYGLEAKVRII